MVDDGYTTYLLGEFRGAGQKERGSRETKMAANLRHSKFVSRNLRMLLLGRRGIQNSKQVKRNYTWSTLSGNTDGMIPGFTASRNSRLSPPQNVFVPLRGRFELHEVYLSLFIYYNL